MKKTWILILGVALGISSLTYGRLAAEGPEAEAVEAPAEVDPELIRSEPEAQPVKKVFAKKTTKRKVEKANSFVAKSDWEFDGFVAGGQDQSIKSMFHLNDLLYLNVGTQQGFQTGDQITVFKRGERVRDPQSGKFMGYEVRRAALTEITERTEEDTCVVRILQSYESVEIGDLIKREN